MKTTILKLMMVALGVLLSVNAHANGIEIDGFFYILNDETKEAIVTYTGTEGYNDNSVQDANKAYKGEIIIPEKVTYKDIVFSVTTIGDDAFRNCRELTIVTIPNSVTSIGFRAFQQSGLTSIIIPNSVTSIGHSAFGNCTGLTSVTIPNSVTSIGNGAFVNCTGLTSVTIPNSVTSIGNRAFEGTLWYDNQEDGVVYAGNVAYKYKGTMPENTAIVIKEGTIAISPSAFSNCKALTSVIIPNSVTSIGNNAFDGCTGLTSVIIPNSVTSIGYNAFYCCSGLTSVTIPNGVASIGLGAFSGCSGLTSVTIGKGITYIDQSAFYGCNNLSAVHIEDLAAWCNISFPQAACNPLSYAHHLFINGEEVHDLTIPNNVVSIGDYVFQNCSDFTSLTIPNSVTSIGHYAFAGCSGLTSVKVHWNRPLASGAPSFDANVKTNATLYVPKGTAMMYMSAAGWSGFVNIMEFEDGEDVHYITIRTGNGGVVKQSVEVGQIYTYVISADEGWSVNTVTFDGKDVTAQMLDGQFSTPVITGNAELNVVFKQDEADEVESLAKESEVKVYARGRSITVTGAEDNAPVNVYSTNGILVESSVGNTTLSLSNGVYIVKVGKETFKVSL